MDPIFKKMNFKGQSPILVLDAPVSFSPSIGAMKDLCVIHDSALADVSYSFYLAFVKDQSELDRRIDRLSSVISSDDVLVWFAYPKKSSKKYQSDISRDQGWSALGTLGFEGVRAVSIDEDWSALRFRRIAYIKALKRDPKRRLT